MEELETALGHRFGRPELLRRALTHSSIARSRAERVKASNERLEFLGDRVLGLVVAQMLIESFRGEDEGDLARRHTALVRKEALARVALEIDLGRHIILAAGEEETGGRDNPALLANACEAVIAAIYLDAGLLAAQGFVRRYWSPMMDEDPSPPKDAKTALQEWAQGRGLPLPRYREVGREGPDHAPVFRVEVEIQEHSPAMGSGPSKRAAEQAAAQAMLEGIEP